MNKTINQLEELQEANSSDELVMYDVSTGTTQKISKKNFLTGTQDFYISASSAVVTGIDLFEGLILKIMFTSAISGTDTETALTISYNDVSYNVKVGKQGALANVYAHEVDTDTYTYIQAYTTLELQFDGTQFIILGNPVVLSSDNYTIYADGQRELLSYSTEEQWTGKYWLDGEKLYRKVYHIQNWSGNNDEKQVFQIDNFTDMDYITFKIDVTYGGSNHVTQYYTRLDEGGPIVLKPKINNGYFYIISAVTLSNIWVTLYYTKTTD